MDYHAPKSSLAERVRTEHVLRRIERQAYGFTTRAYHDRERRQSVAFVVLVALCVLGVALMSL